MTVTAWRIVKKKYQANAFSGEGAKEYGGRWNSPGNPVVYTAESQSLAALEMLVHLESADLLSAYIAFQVTFESSLVFDVAKPLPKQWDCEPCPRRVCLVGDEWLRSGQSAVLRVPSTLIHSENNYLLNPRHERFGKIKISKPAPFRIHPRLQTKLK